jgi:ParB family chromosome partitioning protein
MGKKQEMGKGIRALLSSMETKDVSASPGQEQDTRPEELRTAMIDLDLIFPNPDQPRKEFNQEYLEELAQSIKAMGVIQPLTLRKLSADRYQIIAGERRYRASKMAGLDAVPAYIREADDVTLLEMALVENIQRQDLNAVEVALSFDRLIRECDLTQEALAERVGKKRSTVTNYLRLLKLPPEIQKAVQLEAISMGHARALASIEDPFLLMDIFQEVLKNNLSVRKTESLVQAYQSGEKKKAPKAPQAHSPEVRKILEEVSERFGTRVKMDRNDKGKGRLVIPFNNDHELNFILEVLESLDA